MSGLTEAKQRHVSKDICAPHSQMSTKIKNIPHIDNYTLKKQKHPNALPHTTVFPFTHTGASQ